MNGHHGAGWIFFNLSIILTRLPAAMVICGGSNLQEACLVLHHLQESPPLAVGMAVAETKRIVSTIKHLGGMMT